jgi:cell wall-associated NlpC family hydrolase
VSVGTQQQSPPQGQLVALMAAMTESALRNLNYGDRDSRGLFQMRPSQGWGTVAQITDPVYASETFYRVLLTVPDWQAMSPGAAAQAVERSGFPDRYAKNETDAHQILGAVTGVTCAPPGGGTGGGGSSSGSTCQDYSLPSDPRAETVVKAALCQVGVRYAWGGGTAHGPSAGTGVDVGVVGFDCSGLALYAWEKVGVTVPHQTQLIWAAFQPAITHPADVHPGDLILLSSNGKPGGIHHVGIYLGGGRVVHAPQSGDVVKVTEGIWQNSYWSGEFIGAVRPGG